MIRLPVFFVLLLALEACSRFTAHFGRRRRLPFKPDPNSAFVYSCDHGLPANKSCRAASSSIPSLAIR